jgi:hypothetical protein
MTFCQSGLVSPNERVQRCPDPSYVKVINEVQGDLCGIAALLACALSFAPQGTLFAEDALAGRVAITEKLDDARALLSAVRAPEDSEDQLRALRRACSYLGSAATVSSQWTKAQWLETENVEGIRSRIKSALFSIRFAAMRGNGLWPLDGSGCCSLGSLRNSVDELFSASTKG